MIELSPEAKLILKQEFDTLAKPIDTKLIDITKTLTELRVWLWAARSAAILSGIIVLGGSWLGIAKLQDYVDDRIAARVAVFDRIYLANALSQGGQYRSALQEVSQYLDSLKASSSMGRSAYDLDAIDLSISQRNFLYLTILDAVSQAHTEDTSGDHPGKGYWKSLLNSSFFQRELAVGRPIDVGFRLNSKIASAYLIHADGQGGVENALKYFRRATQQAPKEERWPVIISAYLCAVALKDQPAVTELATQIMENWPSADPNLDWTSRFAALIERLANQLGHKDYRNDTRRPLEEARRQLEEGQLNNILAKLSGIFPEFGKAGFERYASERYTSIIHALYRDSRNKEDLPSSVYNDFMAFRSLYPTLRKKVKSVSSSILEAKSDDEQALITVRVRAELEDIADASTTSGFITQTDAFMTFARDVRTPSSQWKLTDVRDRR